MIPSPNRLLSPIHDLPSPEAWRSKQAKLIVTAVLKAGLTPSGDFAVAPWRYEMAPPAWVGNSIWTAEQTAASMRRYVARLRSWLDKVERQIGVYEDLRRFEQPYQPPRALPGEDQQSYTIRIMRELERKGWFISRAGDIRLEWGHSGGHKRRDGDVCKVCGVAIETAELCPDCAVGNNPFVTADNAGKDLRR